MKFLITGGLGFIGTKIIEKLTTDGHSVIVVDNKDTYDIISKEELERCINMFDQNRSIGHVPKVELVKGDLVETAPDYIEKNPHLVVSLLYLNVNIYEPTKAAIQAFVPRMPKGAVIAFGELDHPECPGETLAVLEGLNLKELELKRVPYDTTRCYAVI